MGRIEIRTLSPLNPSGGGGVTPGTYLELAGGTMSGPIDMGGSLITNTGNGNRFGTSAIIIGSDTESHSFLGALSSAPGSTYYGLVIRGSLSSTGASSVQMAGGYSDFLRTVTSSVTDTGNIFGHQFRVSTNISSGQTYTNSGNAGLIALRISSYNALGSGTYSGNYFGIQYGSDTASITGRKTAFALNSFSGGSLGNAIFADNVSFSGDWFINSTNTNPSLFSGTVTAANLIASTRAAIGTSLSNPIMLNIGGAPAS